jgi:hypothetical protein
VFIFEFELEVVPCKKVSSLPILLSEQTLLVQSERREEGGRKSGEGERGHGKR